MTFIIPSTKPIMLSMNPITKSITIFTTGCINVKKFLIASIICLPFSFQNVVIDFPILENAPPIFSIMGIIYGDKVSKIPFAICHATSMPFLMFDIAPSKYVLILSKTSFILEIVSGENPNLARTSSMSALPLNTSNNVLTAFFIFSMVTCAKVTISGGKILVRISKPCFA